MLSAGNAGHPPTVGALVTGVGLGLGCGAGGVISVGLEVDVGGVEVGLGVDVAPGVSIGTSVALGVGVRVFFACDDGAMPAYGAAAAEALPSPKTRQSIAPSTKVFAFMAHPQRLARGNAESGPL